MTQKAEFSHIANALDLAIKSVDGGYKTVAKQTGIPLGTLYDWGSGRSEPKISKFIELLNFFGLGEDLPLLSDETRLINIEPDDIDYVPLYDVRVSAGDGALNERAEILRDIPFRHQYLVELSRNGDTSNLVMFQARGDSMFPTVMDGDLIMADQNDTDKGDGIFVFIMNGEARIKRFQHTLEGINIFSDNHEVYQPEIVRPENNEDIQIIGRAVWRMGKI